MAEIYVASDGSSSSPYTSWATAHTDLSVVIATIAVSGDIIFVDQNYVQNFSGNLTIAPSGLGTGNPIVVISCDRTGDPAGIANQVYAKGAILDCSGLLTVRLMSAVWVGMTLRANNTVTLGFDAVFRFIDCLLWVNSTNNNHLISCTNDDLYCSFERTEFRFGGVQQSLNAASGARLDFIDCSLDPAGVAIEHFLRQDKTRGSEIFVDGFDFTGANATGVFDFIETLGTALGTATLNRCTCFGLRLPASGGFVRPSVITTAEFYNFYASGTGTGVGDYHSRKALGTTSDETGIFLDSEFLDGGASYSIKLDATAVTTPGFTPLSVSLGPQILAANPTITVELASETAQDDHSAWIDVTYPSAGSADRDSVTSRPVNFGLGTATALTTSGATWTNAPTFVYKIDLPITGGQAGSHDVTVCFAPGATETLYVNPKVTAA